MEQLFTITTSKDLFKAMSEFEKLMKGGSRRKEVENRQIKRAKKERKQFFGH